MPGGGRRRNGWRVALGYAFGTLRSLAAHPYYRVLATLTGCQA